MLQDRHRPPALADDRAQTLANRASLDQNRNLLYWYERLYRTHFPADQDWETTFVLEIGSGSSPLARFYPSIRTSDVLDLEYLDHVFDCIDIDSVSAIPDHSVDIITLTNVLHHLADPILFLKRAARKLKAGGYLVATEPFFSAVATPLYRYLHHELVDFGITEPKIADASRPLTDANIALPFLIFFRVPAWRAALEDCYDMQRAKIEYYTSLSYAATGGISHRVPIPRLLYRALFQVDLALSRRLPRLLASFFTVTLPSREGAAHQEPLDEAS